MTKEEAKREIEKVFEPAFANYIIKALTDGATESDVEPQGDLISREEALNCFPLLMQGELFTVETIRHQLKKLPPVEPQKMGKWVSTIVKEKGWNGKERQFYQPISCSVCRKPNHVESNYCPNCGAKMGG